MSKGAFKKVLNQCINQAALNYLLKIKEKQSKAKDLSYNTLTMQPYLRAESKLPIHLMRQIFQIRSKNLPVKANFSKQYSNEDCVVKECQGTDSQKGLFHCIYLEPKNIVSLNDLEYEDVNGRNVDKQSRVTQIVFEKFQSRQKHLSSNSNMKTPGDQELAPVDPEFEE